METTLLLFSGIAPAVVLMAFILWMDRNKPEPIELIIKGFLLGCLSCVPAAVMEGLLSISLSPFLGIPVIGSVLNSFLVAGCCEEAVKLFMLWWLVRKNPYFDERVDGVVYCVAVGLGFATLENVGYLVGAGADWQSTAFGRALLSVPGHYCFAVIMGVLYGLVHFEPKRYAKLRPWIFLAPMIAHGIYDTFCFWMAEAGDGNPAIVGGLTIMLVVFCIAMHVKVIKALSSQLRKDGLTWNGRVDVEDVVEEGVEVAPAALSYTERPLYTSTQIILAIILGGVMGLWFMAHNFWTLNMKRYGWICIWGILVALVLGVFFQAGGLAVWVIAGVLYYKFMNEPLDVSLNEGHATFTGKQAFISGLKFFAGLLVVAMFVGMGYGAHKNLENTHNTGGEVQDTTITTVK